MFKQSKVWKIPRTWDEISHLFYPGATEPGTSASAKRRASEWGTKWSPVKTLGKPRENQGTIQKIAVGKPWYQWENSMIHGPFDCYVRHVNIIKHMQTVNM
jgi:hypothetical protein